MSVLTFSAFSNTISESGIHRGNEDSCGNENQKSRKNIFSVEKQSTSELFSYEN